MFLRLNVVQCSSFSFLFLTCQAEISSLFDDSLYFFVFSFDLCPITWWFIFVGSACGKWLSVQGFREPKPFHVFELLVMNPCKIFLLYSIKREENSESYNKLLVPWVSFTLQKFFDSWNFRNCVCVLWVFSSFWIISFIFIILIFTSLNLSFV